MALGSFTYEHMPNRNQLQGGDQDKVQCFFSFVGDAAWADGGEAFDLADIGMATVEEFHVNDHLISGGTVFVKFVYDRANDKLVAIEIDDSESTLADVIVEPSGTDFSEITLYGSCFGTPLNFNTAAS